MAELDLLIDIGNSKIKFALADKSAVYDVSVIAHSEGGLVFRELLKNRKIARSIISSTASKQLTTSIFEVVEQYSLVHLLSSRSKVNYKSTYITSETLGLDRIANISASLALFRNQTTLTIDAGTCITYDVLTADGKYQGGAITPGLHMRLKSMNDYSARLPFISEVETAVFPGRSTEQCLESGVFYGILGEINQFISETEQSFVRLKVIITGGDGNHFVGGIKKPIFANPKHTLNGLYELLKINI